jgi:hypothetical protein
VRSRELADDPADTLDILLCYCQQFLSTDGFRRYPQSPVPGSAYGLRGLLTSWAIPAQPASEASFSDRTNCVCAALSSAVRSATMVSRLRA